MYLILKSSTPFLLMFVLVVGSVIVSCTTQDIIYSRNEGVPYSTYIDNSNDQFYITEVFKTITGIVAINLDDRSEVSEISRWDYDSKISELIFTDDLPYENCLLNVQGLLETPIKLKLNSSNTTFTPFLAVNGRVGVLNYDYFWDEEKSILTMADNFNIKLDKFYIFFRTDRGNNNSFGNWRYFDDENSELISHQFTLHVENQLKKITYIPEKYYTFDKDYTRGDIPRVIEKEYSKEELSNRGDISIGTNKARFNISDSKISEEVGFNVAIPSKIKVGDKTYIEENPFISENIVDSEKSFTVSRSYFNSVDSSKGFFITIHSQTASRSLILNSDFIIEDRNLESDIRIVKFWDLHYSSNGQNKPTAGISYYYSWISNGARFEITVKDGDQDIALTLIKEIIDYRNQNKSNN